MKPTVETRIRYQIRHTNCGASDLGQSTDDLPIFIFGKGTAGFGRDPPLRRCCQNRFRKRRVIGSFEDHDHVVLPRDHVKVLHPDASGLKALSSRIEAERTLFDLLQSLRSPFEHCNIGRHSYLLYRVFYSNREPLGVSARVCIFPLRARRFLRRRQTSQGERANNLTSVNSLAAYGRQTARNMGFGRGLKRACCYGAKGLLPDLTGVYGDNNEIWTTVSGSH